mgnify:FL=1
MRELIGWRVFYDNGTECSSDNSKWEDIPADGVLVVVELYDDGSKEIHHSRDYYVLDDGKAYGTNNISPYLHKIGTIKFGRWSKDSIFKKILKNV